MMRARSAFVMLAPLAAIVGCLDATPITLVSDASLIVLDAPRPDDGGAEGSNADSVCLSCIKSPNMPGPGCANELTACDATSKCRFIFDCAYANGCVTKATQGESIACALPCGDQLGASAFETSIVTAIALTTCFHMACGPACEADQ